MIPSNTLQAQVVSRLSVRYPEVIDVLKYFSEDVVVAGGAIRAILSHMHISDVDLYVSDLEIVQQVIDILVEKHGYGVVVNTDNAVTLVYEKKVIQIIKKILVDPQDLTSLFSEFDFTVTMAAYSVDRGLVLHPQFLQDLASRSLIIPNPKLHYPISTLVRTLKYQKHGFRSSPFLLVLIALQVHALNLKTYADLKEQLLGIDTMIFDAVFNNIDLKTNFSLDVFSQRLHESYFDHML